MTPRQVHALNVRRLHTQQREELLVGILAAAVTNAGFCRPEDPVSPEAFMLHPFAPTAASRTDARPFGERLRSLVAALPPRFVRQG